MPLVDLGKKRGLWTQVSQDWDNGLVEHSVSNLATLIDHSSFLTQCVNHGVAAELLLGHGGKFVLFLSWFTSEVIPFVAAWHIGCCRRYESPVSNAADWSRSFMSPGIALGRSGYGVPHMDSVSDCWIVSEWCFVEIYAGFVNQWARIC